MAINAFCNDDQLPRDTILHGHALSVLQTLPSNSIQCCITSPPYWNLRDNGTEPVVWDEDPACQHEWKSQSYQRRSADNGKTAKQLSNAGANNRDKPIRHAFCARCGAWKGELGLEPTPDLYIKHLVTIFREVKRVLRNDGLLWLNIGDTYIGYHGNKRTGDAPAPSDKNGYRENMRQSIVGFNGLKNKDLTGIPWMLAFALRADGWWLRSDNIWDKPNAMPESVRDRCTKSHEYFFMLAKSAKYFYDGDAIRTPLAAKTYTAYGTAHRPQGNDALGKVKSDNWGRTVGERQPKRNADGEISGANKRTVWSVSTYPFPEAHFSVMPLKLVDPAILASTSPQACEQCGAPWKRITKKTSMVIRNGPKSGGYGSRTTDGLSGTQVSPAESHTVGWKRTCTCENEGTSACVVLDPFAGAGTVPLAAHLAGRDYIGIELKDDYISMIARRLSRGK